MPWYVNAIAGMVCLALSINFFAGAYGLRLGGKPLDITTLPKGELGPTNSYTMPLNSR